VLVIVTLLVMTPFLYGLGISTGSINMYAPKLIRAKESNRWPLLGLVLTRSFLVIGIVLGVISSRFHLAGWTLALLALAGVVFIWLARLNTRRYTALENRFLANLNEKEKLSRERTPVSSSIRAKMAGYDVHIEVIDVSPDSSFVGERLKDIPFRTGTGVNIVKIQRGSRSIIIPSGDTVVYPYDHLLAVGTTDQLKAFRKLVSDSETPPEADGPEFEVEPVTLTEDSYLTGRTLRATNMRDYHCMVISVLRGNEFITNPKPDFRFEAGDVVWVAGEIDSLRQDFIG